MKAKRGGMVVMLDLEKAYDRIKRHFVEETLRDASLPSGMINVVMKLL